MDRSILIKEAMYRAFINEIERISGSLSEEDLEKLAAGLFRRLGLGTKSLVEDKIPDLARRAHERAQLTAGNLMTSHKGHLLSEAAQEGLHHGAMWQSIDPSHALTGGAEGVAMALAPAAANVAAGAVRRAAPVVKDKGRRAVGWLRQRIGSLGGPPSGGFSPSFAAP